MFTTAIILTSAQEHTVPKTQNKALEEIVQPLPPGRCVVTWRLWLSGLPAVPETSVCTLISVLENRLFYPMILGYISRVFFVVVFKTRFKIAFNNECVFKKWHYTASRIKFI